MCPRHLKNTTNKETNIQQQQKKKRKIDWETERATLVEKHARVTTNCKGQNTTTCCLCLW